MVQGVPAHGYGQRKCDLAPRSLLAHGGFSTPLPSRPSLRVLIKETIAIAAKKQEVSPLDPDKALTGILALLVAEREDRLNDRSEPRKTETILADAGLGIGDIAQLTGKNYDAVKMTIRRSKGGGKKK